MKYLRVLLPFALLGTLMAFSQSSPIPLINEPLVPDAMSPGGHDFALTVTGTGFTAGSIVNWNGAPLVTSFVASSRLAATVPAADIVRETTASVTVINPGPGGGQSNVVYFSVRDSFGAVSFGESSFSSSSQSFLPSLYDLNRDGKLDLVGVVSDSGVSVSLGNGDGTFGQSVLYDTAAFPYRLAIGDFNGDLINDLAVSTLSGVVSVLLGNGDGSFNLHQDSSTGFEQIGLTPGDFNADGKLDLAVALFTGGDVAVLLGNGDGSFQPPVQYLVGSSPYDVKTGDFDGDGALDLAVTVQDDNAVAVLLGNGDGTFQQSANFPTGPGPQSLATGDFNADGVLDLVSKNVAQGQAGATFSVLLGTQDGTFLSHVDYPTQSNTAFIGTADLNGDSSLDLSVPNFLNNTVTTWLNNGDGTFRPGNSFPVGSEPVGIAIGDLNEDGKLDLVTANDLDRTVSVLLQATAVLSRTRVYFGAVKLGSQSLLNRVALTNISADTLTINSITLEGNNKRDFIELTKCGSSLAPGASCTIAVAFRPTRTGDRTATVTVLDSAASGPQTISLAGKGVQ